MEASSLATVSRPEARSVSGRIPWPVWCALFAVTSAMIGGHWDVSWHRSIGRDTFWTPAHIAIYLCGVLGGLSAGWLILSSTFGRSDGPTVRVLGFRGPLGAFMVAWGGIAMITAAPFDDWWHNAYGLDVKIVSPPHTLLMLGMVGVQLGSLILVLGHQNRASGVERARYEQLFLYLGGTILVSQLFFLFEWTQRGEMHSGYFYRDLSLAVPLTLAGIPRATRHRFSATWVAAVYTAYLLGFLWILPRFPATPKLGPVYQPVTHFVPPGFPLLVIVPAVVIDLLRVRLGERLRPWPLAAVYGLAWLATFLPVQWAFASFLMSPASRNWVFGTHYVDYNARPWWYNVSNQFEHWETHTAFVVNMAIAVVASVLMSRLGIAWGDWMRKIKR
jgi:hypothetical protein